MVSWNLAGNEVDVYLVGPSVATTTVVFVHDVFSMHEGRVKGCCDFLADLGYRVIFPDLHKGDSLVRDDNVMQKIGAWFEAHPVD